MLRLTEGSLAGGVDLDESDIVSALEGLSRTSVLQLTLAGTAYLRASGSASVWTAARDLPAYHQIEQLDVRQERLSRGSIRGKAIRDRDAVLGRYTTAAEKQGRPFDASTLGPALPAGSLKSLFPIGMTATPAQVLRGNTSRGDSIQLLLSADGVHARPVSIERVLVLDVTQSGDNYILTVALNEAQRKIFASTDWTRWSLVREHAFTSP